MCGRYLFFDGHNPRIKALLRQLEKTTEDWQRDALSLGEVFPSQKSPVCLLDARQQPSLTVMRWGMPRFQGSGLIINARSETASQKPLFRESAKLRRCLIPASWYYEWERRAGGKVKYALRSGRGGIVYLGGLYTLGKDGAPRFTVLTRDAAPGIEFIHNRMPVIVPPEKRDAWLSQQFTLDELLGDAETDMEYKPEE